MGYLRLNNSVGWDCRRHWLFLCRGVRTPPPCPGYDTKQSNDETPVMPELWGMQSTPSLPLLPGPLCPGVVALDKVLFMGEIELNCVHMLNWIVEIEQFLHLIMYQQKKLYWN